MAETSCENRKSESKETNMKANTTTKIIATFHPVDPITRHKTKIVIKRVVEHDIEESFCDIYQDNQRIHTEIFARDAIRFVEGLFF